MYHPPTDHTAKKLSTKLYFPQRFSSKAKFIPFSFLLNDARAWLLNADVRHLTAKAISRASLAIFAQLFDDVRAPHQQRSAASFYAALGLRNASLWRGIETKSKIPHATPKTQHPTHELSVRSAHIDTLR